MARSKKTAAERREPPASGTARLPIEELARRSGLTVRNLRQLQTHGVLEPPVLVGRQGFYNQRHVARVALVRRLQKRGYSIAAIRDLLRGWKQRAGLPPILGLEDAIAANSGRQLTRRQIAEIFPELMTQDALIDRARAASLVFGAGDQLRATNVQLLEIGHRIAETGVPVAAMLELVAQMRSPIERLGTLLTQFFDQHVVEPFRRGGTTALDINQLAQHIPQMRTLAAQSVLALLTETLERGGETNRPSEPGSRAKRKQSRRAQPGV